MIEFEHGTRHDATLPLAGLLTLICVPRTWPEPVGARSGASLRQALHAGLSKRSATAEKRECVTDSGCTCVPDF